MNCCHLVLLFSCVTMLSLVVAENFEAKTENGEAEVTFKYARDDGAPSSLYVFDAVHVIHTDNKNRIVGSLLIQMVDQNGDGLNPSEASYKNSNINYTYTGSKPDKYGDRSKASAVLYVRNAKKHTLSDKESDNEIFYGYAPALMRWSNTKDDNSASDIYNKHPFIITEMNVNFKNKAIFKHVKKPESAGHKDSDWIANHGIYRLLDTSKLGSNPSTEYQYNIYYPPIQHLGSYFT